MEIVILGNKESFQLTENNIPLEIRLIAPNLAQSNSLFTIIYDGYTLRINPDDCYKIAENIKGKSPIEVHFALNRIIEDTQFSNSFFNKSLTEVSLFKALFLIYNWVEIAFTDAYAVSIGSKIYNEFIIDYNNQVGSQQDIYFIRKELITNSNKIYLNKLIEVNLLVKLNMLGGDTFGNFETYFIPLIKPGVSRDYFTSQQDPTGEKSYTFWKKILADRDARLNSWMKNRF